MSYAATPTNLTGTAAARAAEREHYDIGVLVSALLLLVLGIAIVLDASSARASQSAGFGNDPFYFTKRHAMWAAIAIGALWAGARFPHWNLRRYWMSGLMVTLLLLVAVMIPHIGKEVNGARRWLGFGPVTFQPSELAKITLVIFLARYSEVWKKRIRHLTKGFLPAVGIVFLIGALVAKEDLGTAIVIVMTGLTMIFMMGAKGRHMAGLLALLVVVTIPLIAKKSYRMDRIKGWVQLVVKPLESPSKEAYQPWQGLVALGSGGLTGHGVKLGGAKHLYLPAEHTDYIFAVIGDDFGLLGCMVIVVLFACLLVNGLTVAHRSRDWFGSMLAAGLISMIGIQALLNIAVVTSILPCTGVPLPFISYGGSSLIFTALAVGIVLNVSRYPSRAAAEPKAREWRESAPDGRRNGRAHLSGT